MGISTNFGRNPFDRSHRSLPNYWLKSGKADLAAVATKRTGNVYSPATFTLISHRSLGLEFYLQLRDTLSILSQPIKLSSPSTPYLTNPDDQRGYPYQPEILADNVPHQFMIYETEFPETRCFYQTLGCLALRIMQISHSVNSRSLSRTGTWVHQHIPIQSLKQAATKLRMVNSSIKPAGMGPWALRALGVLLVWVVYFRPGVRNQLSQRRVVGSCSSVAVTKAS